MNMASLVELEPNPNIPAITSGMTVKVSTRVVEGDKERTQVFQGVIIKVRNRGAGSSFTVRRVTYGVGVERTFPLYSPRVEKVEIMRRGKKRRAKLYYLRGLSAKTSRLKEKRLSAQEMELERAEALRKKQEQERIKAEKLAERQALAAQQEETAPEETEREPALETEQEEVAVEETKQEPTLEVEPEVEQVQEPAPEAELEVEQETESEEKEAEQNSSG